MPIPDAAPVPASPMKWPEPTLLAKREAPTWVRAKKCSIWTDDRIRLIYSIRAWVNAKGLIIGLNKPKNLCIYSNILRWVSLTIFRHQKLSTFSIFRIGGMYTFSFTRRQSKSFRNNNSGYSCYSEKGNSKKGIRGTLKNFRHKRLAILIHTKE